MVQHIVLLLQTFYVYKVSIIRVNKLHQQLHNIITKHLTTPVNQSQRFGHGNDRDAHELYGR